MINNNRIKRNIFCVSLIAASLFFSTGCEEYLDVNTNPNAPDQVVAPHLYLPAMQSELALGIQFDSRYLGKYVQNWVSRDVDITWDLHGYAAGSDAAGQLWRAAYYSFGANLTDMITKAEEEKKYDFVGVGYIMRALGWQIITDYHGEAVVSEAFNFQESYKYDTQEFIYGEVKRLTELGISYLERTDGVGPEVSLLSRGDLIYDGDRAKWIKFAYGLLAINAHHLSNKSSYNPAQVIEYVNKSLASNADDASVRFQGSVSDDTNFFGPRRGNLNTFRQSYFIVGLLDGTNPTFRDPDLTDPVFTGEHLKDPRLPVMLSPSPDGEYRGVFPSVGMNNQYSVASERPKNLWNTETDVVAATAPGKYLFGNDTRFPIMTYAQLQFIKAEAAYLNNDKTLALDAYTKGVNAHLDFVKTFTTDATFNQRREAYMASPALIPATPADLTLSKIMLQKYIAQWGWGFIETWSDLRRYHYTENEQHQGGNALGVADENAADNVFRGFMLPTTLYSVNQGMPAYRVRPRFNSEYMWNRAALDPIGGLKDEYHTMEMWFSKKE